MASTVIGMIRKAEPLDYLRGVWSSLTKPHHGIVGPLGVETAVKIWMEGVQQSQCLFICEKSRHMAGRLTSEIIRMVGNIRNVILVVVRMAKEVSNTLGDVHPASCSMDIRTIIIRVRRCCINSRPAPPSIALAVDVRPVTFFTPALESCIVQAKMSKLLSSNGIFEVLAEGLSVAVGAGLARQKVANENSEELIATDCLATDPDRETAPGRSNNGLGVVLESPAETRHRTAFGFPRRAFSG